MIQQDRRERLIKLSRDITTKSKRLIFWLHRIKTDLPSDILPSAASQTKEIYSLWDKVAKELNTEGKGSEWRYWVNFRSGLGEFVRNNRALNPIHVSNLTFNLNLSIIDGVTAVFSLPPHEPQVGFVD